MSRRLKLATVQKGYVEVLRIQENADGTWEEEWDPLRHTPLASLVSRMSQRNLDHGLNGYTKPFIDALGISPEGAIRKLPSQECATRQGCPFYEAKKCLAGSKKLPWCFKPEGIDGEARRHAAAQAVFLWRDKVYLVVVHDA